MKFGQEDLALKWIVYALLALLCFVSLYPFWNAVVISFNEGKDTMLGNLTFWPRAFTFENYSYILQDEKLYRALGISVLRTIVGTALSIFFTALLAYGLSRKGVAWKKFYMIFLIVTMYFSGGLIPTYLWMRELHLFNNFWVLVIPGLINVWNMIVFRTFFAGLPDGLEESAKLDGCTHFGIFFRIIIFVSGPIIATLSLFTAVYHWNDFFQAMIYINNQNLLPVQTFVINMMNSNLMTEQLANVSGTGSLLRETQVTYKSLQMATMVVSTLPILLVYPFIQKYFVKGVLVGSLKE